MTSFLSSKELAAAFGLAMTLFLSHYERSEAISTWCSACWYSLHLRRSVPAGLDRGRYDRRDLGFVWARVAWSQVAKIEQQRKLERQKIFAIDQRGAQVSTDGDENERGDQEGKV